MRTTCILHGGTDWPSVSVPPLPRYLASLFAPLRLAAVSVEELVRIGLLHPKMASGRFN